MNWSWVYDWTRDEARLLVHDVLAISGRRPESTFRLLEDPFSSGAAAHRSLPLAVQRVLLEIIERDAFMLAWYLQLPLQELDIAGASGRESREMYEYLTSRGIDLRFFDLRVDFELPSVFVVARARIHSGQWRAGGHVLGASTSTTWDGAIRHSLTEILGHYSTFALVSPAGDSSIDPATGQKRLWWPGFEALFKPGRDDLLSFLGRSPAIPLPIDSTAEGSPASSLSNLKAQFMSRGLSIFLRTLAHEAVRQSGLVAIRACVPGLIRMTPSRETANLGEARVETLRKRWARPPGLNPQAHPVI